MRKRGPGLGDPRVKAALEEMGVANTAVQAVQEATSQAEGEKLFEALKVVCKKGYRAAAMRLHPDKNEGDPKQTEKAERFKFLKSIYEGFMRAKVVFRPPVQQSPFNVFTYASTTSTSTSTSGFGWGGGLHRTPPRNHAHEAARRAKQQREEEEIRRIFRRMKEEQARKRAESFMNEDLGKNWNAEKFGRNFDDTMDALRYATSGAREQRAKAAREVKRKRVEEIEQQRLADIKATVYRANRRKAKREAQKKAEDGQKNPFSPHGPNLNQDIFMEDGHTLCPEDPPSFVNRVFRGMKFDSSTIGETTVLREDVDDFIRRHGVK